MSKKQTKKTRRVSDKNARRVVLGATIAGALGILAVMVVVLPIKSGGTHSGVGADGFSVFEVRGADLGVGKAVQKQTVQDALGSRAKSVKDVDNSGVINFNGNKGQTATYGFTTSGGVNSQIDIDVLQYKSQAAYDSDRVFDGTGAAGKINGLEVRYLPAMSIGPDREYALLVTKDLKSYKFSMSQPNGKVEIREYDAHKMLKQLITNAQL